MEIIVLNCIARFIPNQKMKYTLPFTFRFNDYAQTMECVLEALLPQDETNVG